AMTSEIQEAPQHERQTVEMPRPNVWPMVLALGIVLAAAGVALNIGFLVAGLVIFVAGLAGWIGQLLPGRGHHHEKLVEPSRRAKPVVATLGQIEQLHPGRPGYRFQLPEKVHPISAGVKGGLLGGLVMPLPALAYGLLSEHHSIWYPVNLLAGMVLPGVENMTLPELRQFHLTLFVVGVLIHAVNSVVFGLLYGVLLPTLPEIPRPLAWGGLLMPLLWTGVSFTVMGIVNPVLAKGVSWQWFIVSQFIFGMAAALVVMRLEPMRRLPAGIIGGLVGGVLMPLPAILWSLANHHGLWYPVNLLAGMVVPGLGKLPEVQLQQYHPEWLATALAIHALLSAVFGLVYGLLLPKLPTIPASVAWGGLLMPLLWTATAFSLMRVVNPVLQQDVDWPWFIVSQFVFGVVSAIVVHRSEKIPVPPAGPGPTAE
ncbi:MAG TPA: hypothetical protein VMG10_01870, partial [Gemmataceae bacterium]|nr:hypothetical protein [Gemmataceae bacterium]